MALEKGGRVLAEAFEQVGHLSGIGVVDTQLVYGRRIGGTETDGEGAHEEEGEQGFHGEREGATEFSGALGTEATKKLGKRNWSEVLERQRTESRTVRGHDESRPIWFRESAESIESKPSLSLNRRYPTNQDRTSGEFFAAEGDRCR
jgi:hypothetical protein